MRKSIIASITAYALLASSIVPHAVAQSSGQERLRNLMTTKGDLMTTDGQNPVVVHPCPDGQYRVADSTKATGFSDCKSPSSALTPRGPWSSSTAYVANDVVTYSSVTYIANTSNTNVTPGTDGTKWTVFFGASLGYTAENVANKGQNNGYASLDSSGKVPVGQIPALSYQTPLGFTPENSANKGQNNGYAGLGSDGKVPLGQLPAFQAPLGYSAENVANKSQINGYAGLDGSGKIFASLIPSIASLLGFTPENTAAKGAANGYAPLGSDSKVSTSYLPAFQTPLGYTPENVSTKGQPNGYASLDSNGKVPSSQISSSGGSSLPSQFGNGGKVLGTDGTNINWVTNGASPFVDLSRYGATGDGVTDDTSAVQSWANAVVNGGIGKVGWCPSGTYKISAPIIFDPVQAMSIWSDGYGCIFEWVGPTATYSASSIFLFKDLRDSRISNIKVHINSSSYNVADAFRMEFSLPRSLNKRWNFSTDVNGTSWSSSTSYSVGDVVRYTFGYFKCIQANTNVNPVSGTSHASYWAVYGQVDPGHSTFENVYVEGVNGYVGAGFNISGDGDFGDANNDFYRIINSHVNNYNGSCIAITDASQSHENVFDGNECYSFGVGKVGVGGSSDGTVGSTGSYEWRGGYMGGNTVADFHIHNLQVLPVRIRGGSSENSAAALIVDGDTGYNLPVSMVDYRFSTFESKIASDHKVVKDGHPGPLSIQNCVFENADDGSGVTYGMLGAMYFQWSYLMDRSTTPISTASIPQFEFINSKVRSSTHTLATLFPGKKPTLARFESEWAVDHTSYVDLLKTKIVVADNSDNEIATATDYTVTESDGIIRVTDTSTTRTITLNGNATNSLYIPTGRRVTVLDGSGGANSHNITVQAGTGASIAGGNQTISTARGAIVFRMGSDGVWYVESSR